MSFLRSAPVQAVLRVVALGYIIGLGTLVLLADQGQLERFITIHKYIPFGDKVGHFFLMGTLSLLVNLVLGARTLALPWWRIQVGSLLVFAVVLLEECSQLLFPHRSFSLADLASDLAGIWVFGWFAGWLCRKRNPGNAPPR